jgi:anaerobic magnesium-protoporphyrin IX monomethyl ester cyclase
MPAPGGISKRTEIDHNEDARVRVAQVSAVALRFRIETLSGRGNRSLLDVRIRMNVLLVSMPDYFEHMPPVAVRMPNGALTSLAGNVDAHHRVAIADLILCHGSVRETLIRLIQEFNPEVIGLSVMTFQRRTAGRIIGLARAPKPSVKIVVGGYDPSLAPEAYQEMGVDYIVRGEGEITFRELLRALESGVEFASIGGLSYRAGERWLHNPVRSAHRLEDGDIRLPKRSARVLRGYTLLGRPVDVVETSRGCTYDCSFCSIIEMRGRNFHTYSFERVLADIRDARDHGARTIFLVDDNITLNARRFEALCHAIIEAGLNQLDYFVQAMTSAIADHGALGAADAARGLPLRFSRDRKCPRRRPAILAGSRQEYWAQGWEPGRKCHTESH